MANGNSDDYLLNHFNLSLGSDWDFDQEKSQFVHGVLGFRGLIRSSDVKNELRIETFVRPLLYGTDQRIQTGHSLQSESKLEITHFVPINTQTLLGISLQGAWQRCLGNDICFSETFQRQSGDQYYLGFGMKWHPLYDRY